MTKYSVLIPFYNEEAILEKNVLRVYDQLKGDGLDFELLLIDDSSNDESHKIAENLARAHANVHLISYKNGPSRRENLFWSFPKAKGEIIAFTDLDLAVHEKYFKELFHKMEQESADIGIGSRYEPGAKVHREFWRRIISHAYRRTVQIMFSCPVSDFQCGFKAFKKERILPVLDECGYDNSFKRGWFFDAELIIRSQKKCLKTAVIPVVWNSGEKSSFRILREIKVIPYMLKLWWRQK